MNPGYVKLDLFCKGMRIDSSCELGKDGTPLTRTRGGLGSGLELMLPEGVRVNVPVVEHFCGKSPYTLHKEGGEYLLRKSGKPVFRVRPLKEPRFYSQKTSSGKPMSRIGVMQGTYLGIYPTKVCRFWTMKPRKNCKFCSVGLNLGETEETEKSVQDVLETVRAARKEMGITFVHFNTGFYEGKALDEIEPYIRVIKKRTRLLVGVQCPPSKDLKKYDRLKGMGVDHVSFCLELYDPESFRKICPGKDEHLGQKAYMDAMDYCVKLFGKGKVSGEIIAGLESAGSTIRAIEDFASRGIVSNVCVFRPCRGTDLEKESPPRTEDMVPVFRRNYEVCLENNIPIGIAPNISVSIIMLPDEGRYLTGKRYPGKKARMALMKALFRTYFRLRMMGVKG
jgi:biotin synthase-related radical SAM superfamily protein